MNNLAYTQKGIGLIEVLVSLLLLAIGTLGYTALQTQAIKATDESFERSQSLVMMRSLGEKVRTNPSAISIYEEELNKDSNTMPANSCGLDGSVVTVSNLCDAEELAKADIYSFKQELATYNFDIQMHPCPNTGGTGNTADSNIMYSYCLISAWGNTSATIGNQKEFDENSGALIDCISSRLEDNGNVVEAGGNYHPNATCMMMEL